MPSVLKAESCFALSRMLSIEEPSAPRRTASGRTVPMEGASDGAGSRNDRSARIG